MPSGIIVIDKPMDWTSHDVVARLRRLLGERRIGHGGTLDPMATGVLPVFVGRATRAVEFVMDGDKEYIAHLRLGVTTDTQDTTGTVLHTHPVTADRDAVEEVLSSFRGEITQLPPMYSAVKQKGKKLYELARSGTEVERTPRKVTIHDLRLLEQVDCATYRLQVVCSKGTYIRTLCHDIGEALGCGGAMSALRRTRSAQFTLEQAVSLEAVSQAAERKEANSLLLPVDTCFISLPTIHLPPALSQKCRNGCSVPWRAAPGKYRVYDGVTGEFLLLGHLEQTPRGGRLNSIKSFYEV